MPAKRGAPRPEPPKPVSRAEARIRLDEHPYYPPVPDWCAYLVEHWRDLGRVGSNGMGPTRLTCVEVAAWIDLTGHELEAWEVDLLRSMSKAFVDECSHADEPSRPPPWGAEVQSAKVADAIATAKQIRNTLRS